MTRASASQRCAALLKFQDGVRPPVPIEEVEPATEIVAISTGAMSYGSISAEAHETLAIAMNRLGARSNSGEGGEAVPLPGRGRAAGAAAPSAGGPGRFGVTSHYLRTQLHRHPDQDGLQGAKPGEGGQLPVTFYPWVVEVRHSTPGVAILPPPHHDILLHRGSGFSWIHDLKNANPQARIHVKLVSENGVGTVAAGVSKAHADVVLISVATAEPGYPADLAEARRCAVGAQPRDPADVAAQRIARPDRGAGRRPQLKTARRGHRRPPRSRGVRLRHRPLVVSGCIMMRVCHLDTCPVGVATQNPVLRERFNGKPEFVVNFFMFIAEEVRELMAQLGFRTINEMVGQVNSLNIAQAAQHWKAHKLDLAPCCMNRIPRS